MSKPNQNSPDSDIVNYNDNYRCRNQANVSYKSNKYNSKYAANNTRINKMADEQVAGTLKYHGLNARGSPEVLRKRLREFMKRQMDDDGAATTNKFYSYFLIIDFEATCDEINGVNFQHEIIEFPIILYDVVLGRKVDVFHAYCKPNMNPLLSEFCMTLTSIDQRIIDDAKSFPEVLTEVEQWLNKHRMFTKSFAVVCDCNADMAKFMRLQCNISNIDVPVWCKSWINIVKAFRQFYGVANEVKLNMQRMLSSLGLEFEGRQHSGLNDAENILRITETMMADGCILRVNEKLDQYPPHFTAAVTRTEAETGLVFCVPDQSDEVTSKLAVSARPFSTVPFPYKETQLFNAMNISDNLQSTTSTEVTGEYTNH